MEASPYALCVIPVIILANYGFFVTLYYYVYNIHRVTHDTKTIRQEYACVICPGSNKNLWK